MKKLLLAALLPLCLLASACASVVTPERCETSIIHAETADAILAVLIERGVEPARAQLLRDALLIGRITATAACAGVNVQVGVPVGVR